MLLLGPLIKATSNVLATAFGPVPVVADAIKTVGGGLSKATNFIAKWSLISMLAMGGLGLISAAAAPGLGFVTAASQFGGFSLTHLVGSLFGNAFQAVASSPKLLLGIGEVGLDSIVHVFNKDHLVGSDLIGGAFKDFVSGTTNCVATGWNALWGTPMEGMMMKPYSPSLSA
jgi:hypothetical protein